MKKYEHNDGTNLHVNRNQSCQVLPVLHFFCRCAKNMPFFCLLLLLSPTLSLVSKLHGEATQDISYSFTLLFIPLKHEAYLGKIQEFSSSFTENTLHSHCKVQVVDAVYFESNAKHINTLCGQVAQFVNNRAGGTYRYHCALNA
jgi:hypothetical protein